MTDELGTGLAELAGRLSAEQVRSWCAVLRAADRPRPELVADLVTAAGGAGAATELVELWVRFAPELPGAALALALHSAACVHEQAERRRPRLVVTGPATTTVPVRLTSSVVLGVVAAATNSILLVSFAAQGVTDVVRELSAAADRGVRVDLVLETTVEHGGRLRGGAGSGAFDALAGRATFWHWPLVNRQHGRAALHAKVLVADARTALLSSANFTDRGFGDNIEVGVLLPDPEPASRLDQHFRRLMLPEARCLSPLPVS